MQYDEQDLATLARTLWGEARGEPDDGVAAVAWVIRNRASRAGFAGGMAGRPGAIDRVCRAPWQFSCWNEGDPNRALMQALTDDRCARERAIALAVLEGNLVDPTQGADHYHTIARPGGARNWPPFWAPGMRETARFGGHVFYDSRSAR